MGSSINNKLLGDPTITSLDTVMCRDNFCKIEFN